LLGRRGNVDWIDEPAPGKEGNQLKNKSKAQERSERMSVSVSSHTSFDSRRSAGNSRSDGRSNCRGDRANSHDEFHGIKFAFGRPDQVQICLQSMKKLGDCAGTKMNNNMCKLANENWMSHSQNPRLQARILQSMWWMSTLRELMKRKLDKEDNRNDNNAKLFGIIMTKCSSAMKDELKAQSTELEKLEDDNDGVGLLDMTKALVCNTSGVRNKFVVMQSR